MADYLTGGLARRRAWRAGSPLELSPKEFGVLELLAAAQGRAVPAEELLARVWDEFADPFTTAVKITISRLRAKLGDPPAHRDGAQIRLPDRRMTVAVGHRLTALAAAPGLSRRTIRMRLTLIYGGLFLICGAGLPAITYIFVSNATAGYFSSTGPNGYTVGGFAGGPHGAKPRGGPAAGLQNSGCRGPSRSAPGQAQAVSALRRRQRRMQAVIASRPGERFAGAGGQGWTDMRPSGPVRPGPARRTEA